MRGVAASDEEWADSAAAVIRARVGAETFARGRHYASSRAVRSVQYADDGRTVFGQVQGSASRPYTATAILRTDSSGEVIAFHGTCTCPMRVDCKHTVALALHALGDEADAGSGPAPMASWEVALRGVTETATTAPTGAGPPVALQLEVVARSTSPRTGLTTPAHVSLRPVVPGRGGAGWVRSGITWAQLPFGPLRWEHPDMVQLLREIAAADPASTAGYYGGSVAIALDAVPSPRIWTLLADATAMGIPLVLADRAGSPVLLSREPAEVAVQLTRSTEGLALDTRLRVNGGTVDLAHALLCGQPPHGIAWWSVDEFGKAAHLQLARLAGGSEPLVADLLERHVVIPPADEPRFWSSYFPSLQRRLPVTAPAGDVEIPVTLPPTLEVTVAPFAGTAVEVSLGWRYPVGDTARREPLRGAPSPLRDGDVEQEVLARAEPVLTRVRGLAPGGWRGHGLVDHTVLHDLEAARFVAEVLPALEAIEGVTVVVAGPLPHYREADEAPLVSVSTLSSDGPSPDSSDWLDLHVTVTVDGEPVPFESLFLALASGQTSLVLPSGTWFSLDTPELRGLADLIAEARALNERGPSELRVTRWQASLWDDLERLAVLDEQAARWQAATSRLSRATELEPAALPTGLRASLRPYQADGFAWLSLLHRLGLGGVLADEMGLGKTLQTIAMIASAVERGEAPAPFLVVAPTSVVYTWLAECTHFAPDLTVAVVTETGARRGRTLAEVADGAHVVVTSYALFRLEYDEYAALPWSGLVLDEAQFVKNAKSRTWACAKRLPAPFKLAITGTPMENSLAELWALLSITAPGLFPHQGRFDEWFRRPIERDDDRERLAALRERIRPLMLRRTKEQVAGDLPSKQEQVLELPLHPRHRKVYDTYLARERQKVLGLLGDLEKNRFAIFRSLTLLRQAALDVSLVDDTHPDVPSTKLDALMEMLDEVIADGHRVLVFSQFTRFLGMARERLLAAGVEHCYLDGSTTDRAAVVAGFRGGTAPVFLISLKAGGFGLTLTEADYAVLLDPWWNPATEAQAVDRIHRIGQPRSVMVYRLVAKDTIEEKVMALKARKAALFASVLADGGAAPRGITAADIRDILS